MNFINDNFIQRRLNSQSKNSRAMMGAREDQKQASANTTEAINIIGEAVGNVATSACDMFSILMNKIDEKENN